MAFNAVASSGIPISTGLRIGWVAWWSRLGERPSQNIVCSSAAFSTVGAVPFAELLANALRDGQLVA